MRLLLLQAFKSTINSLSRRQFVENLFSLMSWQKEIRLPGPLSLSGVYFTLNPNGSSGWKAHRRVGSCGSFGLCPPSSSYRPDSWVGPLYPGQGK